ncbi:MAG: insulinase family protein [Cyanobacteria bacterium SIG26]|nr:insulinase family protein [Cyanobacteria bacterium SIG26]
MNYINNYLNTNKANNIPNISVQNAKAQVQQQVENGESSVKELSNVVPDYNVQKPIAYTQLPDIKINDDLIAKSYKLANGQRVIILPKDGSTVVKTYVNTGSFNEPDNLRGISHYIEHNLFNGSEDLGEKVFFDEVHKMGAGTNASTYFDKTDYYIQSQMLDDADLETKIQLHAGMLKSPKFLIEKLEKEKKIVNSEINMYMGYDDSIGFTQMIKNLFNVKSSSLDLVAGTTDNITRLTRDDVVNYYNNNYYPANMTTVITGEVNPDETIKLISKYFNGENKVTQNRYYEKLSPITNTIRQDIISSKSEGMATIMIGFEGPKNGDFKEKVLVSALNNLAGGLVYSRVSDIEKKYGTGIGFINDRLSSKNGDPSVVAIQTQVPDDQVENILKEIYGAISKLSTSLPTEEELQAIKIKLKKQRSESLEVSYLLNNILGKALLENNENDISKYNEIVDSITAVDIQNAAKKYMDLNRASLVVVHPKDAQPDQIIQRYNQVMHNSKISFTGLNKKTPIDVNAISTYRLANNVEVVLNESQSDVVQYGLDLTAKKWTPKEIAIASVLDDMFDRCGTKDISAVDLSKKADKLAVSLKGGVSQYGISYTASFPSANANESMGTIVDLIMSPDLKKSKFEESVKRIRAKLNASEPSPYDNFAKAMYKDLPLMYTNEDYLKSLNNITFEDVVNFHKEILEKSQGQVVVTGPFSKNPELKQEVFNSLSKLPVVQPKDLNLPNVYTQIDKPQVYTKTNFKNQADIVLGYKFKHNGNIKDRVAMDLLNDILGGSASSRLFMDLRESRHLAYSVGSNINFTDDIGVMMLDIGTTTENLETGEKSYDNIKKSIIGFQDNIKRITTEKVSDEELDNAKKQLKTTLLSIVETNSGKNSMLSSSVTTPYGVSYENQMLEVIDSITKDDIYNVANYIFKGNPVYSMTATKESIDANKEFLDSLKF